MSQFLSTRASKEISRPPLWGVCKLQIAYSPSLCYNVPMNSKGINDPMRINLYAPRQLVYALKFQVLKKNISLSEWFRQQAEKYIEENS